MWTARYQSTSSFPAIRPSSRGLPVPAQPLRMNGGLYEAPLPQTRITFAGDQAVAVELPHDLADTRHLLEVPRLGDQHFADLIGVEEDKIVVGPQAQVYDVAVVALQAAEEGKHVGRHLPGSPDAHGPIAWPGRQGARHQWPPAVLGRVFVIGQSIG